MADPKPTSERLQALQARWESDRGSRLFLQLADEYRRLGREEDAVRVLDEGLEANPGHVGARVARGRNLLALGRAREATADLEQVIEADPTQMVAYRFLVEGYIQQRDADQARQRLRVYGLLNDADPDIEELDKKIRDLERAERTGAWPMPATEEDEPGATAEGAASAVQPEEAAAETPSESTDSSATEGLDEPFAASLPPLPETGDRPGDEALDLEDAPFGALADSEGSEPPPGPDAEDREEPFAPPSPPPQRVAKAVDPFPALTIPEDRRRYLAGFDDSLFEAPATEGSGDLAAETPQPIGLQEPEEVQETPSSSAPSDPFDLAPPPRAAAPDLGALLSGEEQVQEEPPAPLETSEPVAVGEPPEELPTASAAAPAPEPEPEHEPEAELSEQPEPSQSAPSEPASPEAPPAASAPDAAVDEGRATVTLGRLYLRQGHLEEAEESFQEVLEREPDNAEARRGLEEVAALRTPSVDVADLLDGYEPARHGEGLTARKRYAMRRYLERLRGGGADVH